MLPASMSKKVYWISPYPLKNEGKVGLETYAKSILQEMPEITVLAEDVDKDYSDPRAIAVWKRSLLAGVSIFTQLLTRTEKADIIHWQHEFFAYGGYFAGIGISLKLLAFKLMGRKVVTTIHGVVSQNAINSEFIRDNSDYPLPGVMVRLAFNIGYRLACWCSNIVVTHDHSMANILTAEYGLSKAKSKVIPLFIQDLEAKTIDEEVENKVIKKPINLLFFGFVVPYKGLETVLEMFEQHPKSEMRLVVAGGKNTKKLNDKNYLEYYQGLESRAEQINRKYGQDVITWHGYAAEAEVPELFSQADIVLIPYKYKLAGSGPMVIAANYKKIFLASDVFAADVSADLVYGNSANQLHNKIIGIANSKEIQLALVNEVKQFRQQHSLQNVISKHKEIYDLL